MKATSRTTILAACAVLFSLSPATTAQVPGLFSYQGRITVNNMNFDGDGLFKFALVNTNGTVTYWSNDGTSTAGSQPTNAVPLAVSKGLYSVLLGDIALANMTAVQASVFANADVRLRVWFNDGVNGFQLLAPDQRIAAVGYAMTAATVPDGTVTNTKIADGAVTSAKIGGMLTSGQIPAVDSAKITDGTLVNADIAASAAIADTKLAAITAAGKVANSATTGTSANAGSTLVLRDASGNFTAGTITAHLNGNAATATSAGGFTGTLAGDIIGVQGGTVVSQLAGMAAGDVAAGATLASAATSADMANALVRRDANGNFAAGTLTATLNGNAATATSAAIASTVVNGAITTDKLDDSSVTTPKLANGAVNAAKLADLAVAAQHLANSAVTSGKIASGAVTADKIPNSSITAAKLAFSTGGSAPLPWIVASGELSLLPNRNYLIADAAFSGASMTLPATPQLGDSVKVKSVDAVGDWVIWSNSGQVITLSTVPGAWVPVANNLPVTFKAMASSDDATYFLAGVVANGGIYTSTDSGVTWTLRTAAGTSRNWSSIASSMWGDKLVATVNGGYIYTSADSGATWTQRTNSSSWRGVTSSDDGTKLAAIRGSDQIWVSSDSGVTWTARGPSDPFNNKFWGGIASSSDGSRIVLVVNTLTAGDEVFVSTDFGLNWSSYDSPYKFTSVVCSADGQTLLASTDGNQLLTSNNGGASWTVRGPIASWSSLACSSSGSKMAAATGTTIYTSADYGQNWTSNEPYLWGPPTLLVISGDGGTTVAVGGRGSAATGATSISTLTTAWGSVGGAAGSLLELVYVGNGTWIKTMSDGSVYHY